MENDDRTTTQQSPPGPPSAPTLASLSQTSDIDEGRFLPGTLLNQRYRIINLIGRGGMGEVYRANDLILGQPVALKFLPAEMARDESALVRFRNEVRVARQVSHPNVCRVYDLGEADGHPYLSMEYIDGEDLSTLIKRIGRLPQDKGVEIARQLCAGLAAAHDKGVLHRDLKPSNILMNSKGQVSITDFGLAGLVEQVQADVRSGTPAYMAPEQLAGLNVTVKSDIYALGLVLYELFSGKRAHEGQTRNDLLRMKESGTTPHLSSVVKDLDPAIERIIERCLQPDPLRRPASALTVAAALPGGDPLAAALAAGETPSPEMVAAAGSSDSMRPLYAFALVVLIVAGWIAQAVVNGRMSLLDRIPFEMPTDALAQKAKETIATLGYGGKPGDVLYGFSLDRASLQKLNEAYGGAAWNHLSHIRPTPVYFWYRTSPDPLWPMNEIRVRAGESDPPMMSPGMVRVSLDSDAKLRSFLALPRHDAKGESGTYSWEPLFQLAGIDPQRFAPAEAERLPQVSFDQRAAWTGTLEGVPHRFRVEAAAFKGKPVYFSLQIEIDGLANSAKNMVSENLQAIVILILRFGGMTLAVLFALRNYRAGRGDLPGAVRLGVLVFASVVGAQLLLARYNSITHLSQGLWVWMSQAVMMGGFFGTLYLALEPSVRRRWPTLLISWSRALSGKFTDPLVGRHILIGLAVGVFMQLLDALGELANNTMRVAPIVGDLGSLLGIRAQYGLLLSQVANSIGNATFSLFIVMLIRMLVRNQWLSIAVTAVIFSALGALSAQAPLLLFSIYLVVNLCVLYCLLQYGYLPMLIAMIVNMTFTMAPPDLNLSAWYTGGRSAVIVALIGVTLFAYFSATHGQKVLSDELD